MQTTFGRCCFACSAIYVLLSASLACEFAWKFILCILLLSEQALWLWLCAAAALRCLSFQNLAVLNMCYASIRAWSRGPMVRDLLEKRALALLMREAKARNRRWLGPSASSCAAHCLSCGVGLSRIKTSDKCLGVASIVLLLPAGCCCCLRVPACYPKCTKRIAHAARRGARNGRRAASCSRAACVFVCAQKLSKVPRKEPHVPLLGLDSMSPASTSIMPGPEGSRLGFA